jgi:hypothetical protein
MRQYARMIHATIRQIEIAGSLQASIYFDKVAMFPGGQMHWYPACATHIHNQQIKPAIWYFGE